jgi:hypothetical protein
MGLPHISMGLTLNALARRLRCAALRDTQECCDTQRDAHADLSANPSPSAISMILERTKR